MLYVDIPTQSEISQLIAARGEAQISIYLKTTPETQHIDAARTRLKQLTADAVAQLEEVGVPKRTIWPIEEQLHDLMDDDDFWRVQANSLAIFVTPESLRSYRLPNHLTETAQVSDRFHIKPLLRAVSMPQHAFVLALAENELRVVELLGDQPAQEIRVPGLPKDAASVAGTANVNSRSYSGRQGGGEGQKHHLRQYCRQIDAALRGLLAGRHEPLIIAAAEPLLSIYRSVNSYPHLADDAITTSPVRVPAHDLGSDARKIVDEINAASVAAFGDLYAARENEGRATTQVARAARAATFGAVDTLLVDMDTVVPGLVDETTGEITLDKTESAVSYGVIDEIAGRVIAHGGKVIAVRRADIPQEAELAAVLRYAI
ncbi:MAG: baeRF11 domain-containing protein [Roseinatronobacter sp.]